MDARTGKPPIPRTDDHRELAGSDDNCDRPHAPNVIPSVERGTRVGGVPPYVCWNPSHPGPSLDARDDIRETCHRVDLDRIPRLQQVRWLAFRIPQRRVRRAEEVP